MGKSIYSMGLLYIFINEIKYVKCPAPLLVFFFLGLLFIESCSLYYWRDNRYIYYYNTWKNNKNIRWKYNRDENENVFHHISQIPKKNFFNWRVIALQCCGCLSSTSTQINHNFILLLFSCWVVSYSVTHGLKHARPLCPSKIKI